MARGPRARTAPDTILVVDKPAGMTSHDVVARVRRLVGSRKVGHAGTLDPMATGVLVLGVERATRLLGHLVPGDKEYEATIRLGVGTVTDDAEGEVTSAHGAAGLEQSAIRAGVAALTGELAQVPAAVSAVKVDGVRAYRRVRDGEPVALAARPVTVRRFEVRAIRPGQADAPAGGSVAVVDVDVQVACSAGTYVRALARDLGAALGVGGHLTALRRTRVGPYDLTVASTLEQLADATGPHGIPLLDAVRRLYPVQTLTAEAAERVRHGSAVPADGQLPEGALVGLATDSALLALGTVTGALIHPFRVLA